MKSDGRKLALPGQEQRDPGIGVRIVSAQATRDGASFEDSVPGVANCQSPSQQLLPTIEHAHSALKVELRIRAQRETLLVSSQLFSSSGVLARSDHDGAKQPTFQYAHWGNRRYLAVSRASTSRNCCVGQELPHSETPFVSRLNKRSGAGLRDRKDRWAPGAKVRRQMYAHHICHTPLAAIGENSSWLRPADSGPCARPGA